jgi:hypothetical protein
MLAEETTTASADRSPEPTMLANQLSALDAAAKVLGETGRAMNDQSKGEQARFVKNQRGKFALRSGV